VRAASVPLVTFELPAEARSVGTARRWLRAFASEHGGGAELQARVSSALTEAFANAVLHAYAPPDVGRIDVAADIEDGALEIVVVDDGSGLRASPSDGQSMGMGFGIIASTADAFAIRERVPQGTEVWLRFELAGS
jgi:stage II sporulation protein AB (anti-sigma F factor)